MRIEPIEISQKDQYNQVVSHPLQSYEWGEFRKKLGTKVLRYGISNPDVKNGVLTGAFQLTLHPVPHLPLTIGYLPKGDFPSDEIITKLAEIGKNEKSIFIQIEPNVIKNENTTHLTLSPSVHPLFTKYTFLLNLEKSEEELLQQMHPKTRYNIKIAKKHNVVIQEETSKEAFQIYLNLTEETTKRQGFYAHTKKYHTLMWETLQDKTGDKKGLTAHLFIARYNNIPVVAWIVFVFHDTLYYPYGASSSLYRETMASNLMMWEVIRWGKQQKLKMFDMWGASGRDPDPKDPFYGFHRFKQGYGATLTEFVGSFDIVTNPLLYQGFKIADKVRWGFLRFKTKI